MLCLVNLLNCLDYPMHLLRSYAWLNVLALGGWSVAAFLLLSMGSRSGLRSRLTRLAWWSGVTGSVVCLGALLLSTAAYARAPGVMDHVEVSVITISSLWGQGKPLYLGRDAAERYSLGYGPDLYLFDSAALAIFGSRLRVVKTLGAVLLLASFLAMGICARRLGCSRSGMFLVLGYIAAAIAVLETFSCTAPIASWARSDPHLLFWACFSALCTTCRRSALVVLGIGVAIGISVNLKAHGPVYILPMFLPLFWRTGARGLVACFAIAAVVAFAPFAIPGISLPNYLRLLSGLVGDHAFSPDLLFTAIKACTFFLLPIFAMFFVNLRSAQGAELQTCRQRQIPLVLSIVLATLITLAPASKEGNLTYHLLPLIPGYAMVFSSLLPCPRIKLPATGWAIRGSLALAAGFTVIAVSMSIVASYEIGGWSLFNPILANPGLNEINEVCQRYPGQTKAMGYGTDESYPWTFCRPVLNFRGQPDLIDATEAMEFRLTNLPTPQATIDALRDGFVDVWMIPKGGEPFSMHSFYSLNVPLFDQRFRDAFRANYELRDHTAHYDLWVHRTVALPIASRAR